MKRWLIIFVMFCLYMCLYYNVRYMTKDESILCTKIISLLLLTLFVWGDIISSNRCLVCWSTLGQFCWPKIKRDQRSKSFWTRRTEYFKKYINNSIVWDFKSYRHRNVYRKNVVPFKQCLKIFFFHKNTDNLNLL